MNFPLRPFPKGSHLLFPVPRCCSAISPAVTPPAPGSMLVQWGLVLWAFCFSIYTKYSEEARKTCKEASTSCSKELACYRVLRSFFKHLSEEQVTEHLLPCDKPLILITHPLTELSGLLCLKLLYSLSFRCKNTGLR